MTSGVQLWVVLMKAHRALHRQALKSIEDAGLCFSDFAVLEVLLHKGPLPVNNIAARIGLTSGSGTTAIDRLEKQALVTRRNNPGDRRARVVHLTPAGRRLIAKALRKHAQDIERAADVLNADEREQLRRLLKKLGKANDNEDLQNES